MNHQVVGVGKRISGDKGKKSGKPYDGQSVYCLCAANDVDGMKTEELYFNYLSSVSFPEVSVGDVIDVDYDRKGFLVDVALVEDVG